MNLDFLGLLPCALKVPFEASLSNYLEQRKGKMEEKPLHYSVVSNANNELSFFTKLKEMTDFQWLPQMVLAPGFNGFFYKDFMESYKASHFCSVAPFNMNPLWQKYDLLDPQGTYTLLGFNPTVFLIDKTVHKELPTPKRWSHLLNPEYKGKVAIRGHHRPSGETPIEFCEGILLNIFKEHGEEGIEKLGKAVGWSLHPSEMIKLAGSKKNNAPAISAVPYSFAKLVKKDENISIVWPEDGAIINPIVLMVKNESEKNLLLEFLLSSHLAKVFSEIGFASIHGEAAEALSENNHYKWLGWDFIYENDLEHLKSYLNKVFFTTYRGENQ